MMKSRVGWCCFLLVAVLSILAGLALRLAEDFTSYECVESWMYQIQMQESHSIEGICMQEGDLLQVELRVYSGNVRVEVLDARGRHLPVIGGWTLIPATGCYTLRFRGEGASFQTSVSCHRKIEEG